MVVWAGALIWPMLALPRGQLPVALFFIFSAALNLLTAAILLLSKKFAIEFAEERKRRPKYKLYLWRGLLVAIIAAMVIATFNDIMRLASN